MDSLQDVDDSIQTIIENEINYKDLEQTAVYKGLVDLITPLRLNNEIQDELVKEGIIQEAVRVSNGIDTFELFYGANFIKNSIKGISEFLEVQTSINYSFSVYNYFLLKRLFIASLFKSFRNIIFVSRTYIPNYDIKYFNFHCFIYQTIMRILY